MQNVKQRKVYLAVGWMAILRSHWNCVRETEYQDWSLSVAEYSARNLFHMSTIESMALVQVSEVISNKFKAVEMRTNPNYGRKWVIHF
jgi:hypothetical protein